MDDQANNDAPQEQPAEAKTVETLSSRRREERRYRFDSPKPPPQRLFRRPQLPQLPAIPWWREALLGLFLLTAVTAFLNPFATLSAALGHPGQPARPLAFALADESPAGYCIAGGFQDWDGSSTPLLDDGTSGDAVAGDGIYARTFTLAEPGRALWRVLACGDWNTAVPQENGWVLTTDPNQPITFTFNPALAEDGFWPDAYAITIDDPLPNAVFVVGSFQARPWDSGDGRTQMKRTSDRQFELVYRVPQPGTYDAYVALPDRSEGVGADGRSVQPLPLQFTTQRAGETVLFQYDAQTNRIAIFSGIPWLLSWLGFAGGAYLLGGIALLGTLVMAVLVGYRRALAWPAWQHTTGCPNCQQPTLRRVNRTKKDYVLNLLAIPIRRYQCPACGWTGRRIKR